MKEFIDFILGKFLIFLKEKSKPLISNINEQKLIIYCRNLQILEMIFRFTSILLLNTQSFIDEFKSITYSNTTQILKIFVKSVNKLALVNKVLQNKLWHFKMLIDKYVLKFRNYFSSDEYKEIKDKFLYNIRPKLSTWVKKGVSIIFIILGMLYCFPNQYTIAISLMTFYNKIFSPFFDIIVELSN